MLNGATLDKMRYMLHGLSNDFLYAAVKLVVKFCAKDGTDVRNFEGTGFFVKNSEGKLCLVTNRHMLDAGFKDEKFAQYQYVGAEIHLKKRNSISTAPDRDVVFQIAGGEEVFAKSIENDVACIRDLKVLGPKDVGGTIDYFLEYEWIATGDDIASKLCVCDFVAFPGFPLWHDQSANRPIFRMGTIASDPRFDYSFLNGNKRIGGQCLAYEAFSFAGSSGSPVFSVQKGIGGGNGIVVSGFQPVRLIGINAGHLPADGSVSHSGISYLYKSPVILEVIG